MMDITVYTLTSPLHDEKAVNAASEGFIKEIERHLDGLIKISGSDFTGYGDNAFNLIYVRTGGTEGLFQEVFPKLNGRILLLTSGQSNSLAASMEILSYLNQKGRSGEIIHGSPEYIAGRIKALYRIEQARKELQGCRLGIIGRPSDWLISSDPDRIVVKEKLGIDLIDIDITELTSEFLTSKKETLSERAADIMTDISRKGPSALEKYVDGAIHIYSCLKKIIEHHSLNGLTLRCFDLLDTIGNTGCLALAMLNSEGIPAGCEGDIPALITMAIGKALTGQCGFQANPSRISPETGEMLLAHCTVPFDMVQNCSYNTHFESGIGIAVHGEMPLGDCTVVKVSGDLSRTFCSKAELTGNPYEKSLCRTQITLRMQEKEKCRNYFLTEPIGNHHIVFTGDHTAIFSSFLSGI